MALLIDGFISEKMSIHISFNQLKPEVAYNVGKRSFYGIIRFNGILGWCTAPSGG